MFIETRLVAEYRDMLAGRGCTIVAMDRSPDLPRDVACFWDLVEAASDADNDCELDVNEHTAILRFTGGTTELGKCAMYSIGQFLAMRDSFSLTTDLGTRRHEVSGVHADVACEPDAVYRDVLRRRRPHAHTPDLTSGARPCSVSASRNR